MGSYRNRLQIIADILFVARNGAKKTQIMFQANLSYQLLTRYLTDIVEAGLVSLGREGSYTLTRKGRKFLDRYEEYAGRCKKLEKYSNAVDKERVILKKMCLKRRQ